MKKLFFLIIPVFALLTVLSSCEELFKDPDCAEGESRITLKVVDNKVCCPEGCICLSEADDDTRNSADGALAPTNDTISVEDPVRGGDPITDSETDDENCIELDEQKAYLVDAGTDGELLISLHDADFEDLKNRGQNILSTESHFTRAYNYSTLDPYFITIVKSEEQNKVIRIAYKTETLFINRISLN